MGRGFQIAVERLFHLNCPRCSPFDSSISLISVKLVSPKFCPPQVLLARPGQVAKIANAIFCRQLRLRTES